jgi:hypothetical protein
MLQLRSSKSNRSASQRKTQGWDAKEAADAEIARYTLWLAIFTGMLVVVTGVQLRFLVRADRTARLTAKAALKSANAATDSADSLRDAERPHLVPSVVNVVGMRQAPNEKGEIGISVNFRASNVGRTPAILRGFSNSNILVGVLDAHPPPPEMQHVRFIIGPNNWYGTVGDNKVFIPQDQIAKVLSGEWSMWNYFVLDYEDAFGHPHRMRALNKLVFGPGDTSERFYPDGPDTYWEYT